MYVKELAPGTPIELSIHTGSDTISLYSVAAEPFHDDLLIEKLEYNGKLLGIPSGYSVDLLYISPGDSRPYIWKNVSLKAVRYKDAIYHCISNAPEEGMPTNRRQAFRLFIGEEMELIVRDTEGAKRYNVILKDISETGMGFVSSEDFPLQKHVRLRFQDHSFTMNLSATIVRKYQPEENSPSCVYGCRFSEPNRILSKYITLMQQKKLQEKHG